MPYDPLEIFEYNPTDYADQEYYDIGTHGGQLPDFANEGNTPYDSGSYSNYNIDWDTLGDIAEGEWDAAYDELSGKAKEEWAKLWGGSAKDIWGKAESAKNVIWDGVKNIVSPAKAGKDAATAVARHVWNRAKGIFEQKPIERGDPRDPKNRDIITGDSDADYDTSRIDSGLGWVEHPYASKVGENPGYKQQGLTSKYDGRPASDAFGALPGNATKEQIINNPELFLVSQKMNKWIDKYRQEGGTAPKDQRMTPDQEIRARHYADSWHYFIGNERYFQDAFETVRGKDGYRTWETVLTGNPNEVVTEANNLGWANKIDYTGTAGAENSVSTDLNYTSTIPTGDDMSDASINPNTGPVDIPEQTVATANSDGNNPEQFWNDLVDEYYGFGKEGEPGYIPSYKDMIDQSQNFRTEETDKYITKLKGLGKEKIAGYDLVTGKYDDQLDALSAEIASGKGDIGLKIGNFETQFTTKGMLRNREMRRLNYQDQLKANLTNIDTGFNTGKGMGLEELGYNLAEADPTKSYFQNFGYLSGQGNAYQDRLNKINTATIKNPTYDPSNLDVIGDIVKLSGDTYKLGKELDIFDDEDD